MRPAYNADILLDSNHMQSCFLICYGNFTGTAFIFRDDTRAFFVTANHTLSQACVGDNLLVSSAEGWRPFPITGLWRDNSGYDCCAFTLAHFAVAGDLRSKTGGALFPGEPVKFLGFPHGLSGNYPGQGFPTPLVRTAYLSGIIVVEGLQITLLDGFNNPGYSGGPVYVTFNEETSLFGVISGYRTEKISHSRIYKKDDNGAEIITEYYSKPNSGMINMIGIERIKEDLFNQVNGSLELI